MRAPIQIDGHTIEIVESYTGGVLGRILKTGAVYLTTEEAQASIKTIREGLADLGRWEQLVSVLRNLKEHVESQGATDAEPLRLEDLDFKVYEQPPYLNPRLEPVGIVFDLARAVQSATAKARRPWLSDPAVWVSAIENLKRWKDLRASIRGLLHGG